MKIEILPRLEEKPFPKLMTSKRDEGVWLVFSETTGVYLGGLFLKDQEPSIRTTLCFEELKDFNGAITLSND